MLKYIIKLYHQMHPNYYTIILKSNNKVVDDFYTTLVHNVALHFHTILNQCVFKNQINCEKIYIEFYLGAHTSYEIIKVFYEFYPKFKIKFKFKKGLLILYSKSLDENITLVLKNFDIFTYYCHVKHLSVLDTQFIYKKSG
jgi:hypothetical protein